MTTTGNKLDNPVWYSLTETHQQFAIAYDGLKAYHPDYCPFGGFVKYSTTATSLAAYSALCNNFYIVGNKPASGDDLVLNKELVCNQMLLHKLVDVKISERITVLGDEHKADLYNLVNLVQPGYFKSRTSALGSYYGIFQNEKLVSVAGERMKMNDFTEVSAVVTHPDHTGKGYAKQLVAFTANRIFNEKKIAYLHVAETNIAAISLYEKLGFITRRKISFWNFVLKGT